MTLREILIEVPTITQQGRAMVNVGKDDEAAKKAEAVRARLTAGEDFAKVAGEVSASAVEGQRRPDRPDRDERARRPISRRCSRA